VQGLEVAIALDREQLGVLGGQGRLKRGEGTIGLAAVCIDICIEAMAAWAVIRWPLGAPPA